MTPLMNTSSFGIDSPMAMILVGSAFTWGMWLYKSEGTSVKNWLLFSTAVLLMIIALTEPFTILAESYFSMHMLQHLLMLMLIPPLLWLSMPEKKTEPPLVVKRLRMPFLNWISGVGLMWILHFPFFYNYLFSPNGGLCSSQSGIPPYLQEWIHPIHLLITLLVGLWFIFPVLNPWKSQRVKPLVGIAFLVSACTACTVLGIVITFAPNGVFDGFNIIPDPSGTGNLLQAKWGLTAAMDQQVAGLLMWVPGCFIYLTGSIYLMNQWFSESNRRPSVDERYPTNVRPSYDQ